MVTSMSKCDTVIVLLAHIALCVGSPYLKYILLIILVIQNAVLILSMRYSRIVEGERSVMLV